MREHNIYVNMWNMFASSSTSFRFTSASSDDLKRLSDQLDKKEAEVKKLNEEKFQKHVRNRKRCLKGSHKIATLLFQGEILYLRGELSKRSSALERERSEKARALDLKSAELKHLEAEMKAQVEKMETEQAFLKHDMESMAAAEQMRKKKRSSDGGEETPNKIMLLQQAANGRIPEKRVKKKAIIPEGIDE
jgi:hypothetical protein